MFHSWSKHLPREVELWSVQLPGRESRLNERPLIRMDDVVRALSREIAEYLCLPFVLFGHSLGGYIVFELTRRLRSQSLPAPRHLFVSGSRAPHLPDPDPPICHFPDNEFVRQMRQRYDGIPPEISSNHEFMRILLIAMRADIEICETYRYVPGQPLDIPMTVLSGADDDVTHDELVAWREHSRGNFRLTTLSGGHFFIQDHEQYILERIVDALHKTDAFTE